MHYGVNDGSVGHLVNGAATDAMYRQAYREPAAQALHWNITGFLGHVRVMTGFGALPIDKVLVNDPIVTTTGRKLLVHKVRKMGLDRDFLIRHPEAQPVFIPRNAFGGGFPERDMHVSPAQEFTFANGGSLQERRRAVDLIGTGSIVREARGSLTYYSLELSEPASIMAEGVAAYCPVSKPSRHDEDDD